MQVLRLKMWESPAIGVTGLVNGLAWVLRMEHAWFPARAVCFLHGRAITPAPSFAFQGRNFIYRVGVWHRTR